MFVIQHAHAELIGNIARNMLRKIPRSVLCLIIGLLMPLAYAPFNILGAQVEPIRNPVTGEPHFISIRPHDGFEFREAEMASATFWSKGELEQQYSERFAAISFVSYGPYGIIAEESYPERKA